MRRTVLAAFASVALMAAVLVVPAGATTGASQRYLVVLAGQQGIPDSSRTERYPR